MNLDFWSTFAIVVLTSTSAAHVSWSLFRPGGTARFAPVTSAVIMAVFIGFLGALWGFSASGKPHRSWEATTVTLGIGVMMAAFWVLSARLLRRRATEDTAPQL